MRLHTAMALALLIVSAGCTTMGNTTPADPAPPAPPQNEQVAGNEPVLPVGQQLDVRLQSRLSSESAVQEQRFETTTLVDLVQGTDVLVPAGSTVRGIVQSAEPAGRVDRTGSLSLAFDRLTVRGQTYEIRALPTQAFEGNAASSEQVTRAGAGGAVGAIVGGILGGARGALLGAAVGAGGVVAATEGDDVVLPAGSVVRIRLDTPVRLRRGTR